MSAYASPCISGEVKRHFRDRRWQIRVQEQDQELLLEMRTAEETLTQAFTVYSLDAPLSSRDSRALLGLTTGGKLAGRWSCWCFPARSRIN